MSRFQENLRKDGWKDGQKDGRKDRRADTILQDPSGQDRVSNKYDNTRRKAFNDINDVDNIKLKIGNKIEKIKLFLAEGSLKALNIFEQFLMTAFESRQQIVEIRRNQTHQKWFEEGTRYFIFQFSIYFIFHILFYFCTVMDLQIQIFFTNIYIYIYTNRILGQKYLVRIRIVVAFLKLQHCHCH